MQFPTIGGQVWSPNLYNLLLDDIRRTGVDGETAASIGKRVDSVAQSFSPDEELSLRDAIELQLESDIDQGTLSRGTADLVREALDQLELEASLGLLVPASESASTFVDEVPEEVVFTGAGDESAVDDTDGNDAFVWDEIDTLPVEDTGYPAADAFVALPDEDVGTDDGLLSDGSDSDLPSMFARLDTDGNGWVSRDDFIAGRLASISPEEAGFLYDQIADGRDDGEGLTAAYFYGGVINLFGSAYADGTDMTGPARATADDYAAEPPNEVFDRLDGNYDGRVTRADFVSGRPANMSSLNANVLYDKIASGNDFGVGLTREDFVRGLTEEDTTTTASYSSKPPAEVFDRLDADGDNRISRDDFVDNRPSGMGRHAALALYDRVANGQDNGEGLDKDAFVRGMQSGLSSPPIGSYTAESSQDLFTRLDANGDGLVDRYDYISGRPLAMSEAAANALYDRIAAGKDEGDGLGMDVFVGSLNALTGVVIPPPSPPEDGSTVKPLAGTFANYSADSTASDLFDTLDTDRDGRISRDDFLFGRPEGMSEQAARILYDRIASGHDEGEGLDREMFLSLVDRMNGSPAASARTSTIAATPQSYSTGRPQSLFLALDSDRDGLITRGEFLAGKPGAMSERTAGGLYDNIANGGDDGSGLDRDYFVGGLEALAAEMALKPPLFTGLQPPSGSANAYSTDSLSRLFNNLDFDDNGRVGRDEFITAKPNSMTVEDAGALYDRIADGNNGEGGVRQEVFIDNLAALAEAETRNQGTASLRALFSRLDTNGDGWVGRDDFIANRPGGVSSEAAGVLYDRIAGGDDEGWGLDQARFIAGFERASIPMPAVITLSPQAAANGETAEESEAAATVISASLLPVGSAAPATGSTATTNPAGGSVTSASKVVNATTVTFDNGLTRTVTTYSDGSKSTKHAWADNSAAARLQAIVNSLAKDTGVALDANNYIMKNLKTVLVDVKL
ncbi:MAG: EF-hand domain-containing protein [Alphaproteobacteria bacterium]